MQKYHYLIFHYHLIKSEEFQIVYYPRIRLHPSSSLTTIFILFSIFQLRNLKAYWSSACSLQMFLLLYVHHNGILN